MVGRAVTEAYRQAAANAQQAEQAAKSGGDTAANTLTSSGLTLDEACKILNVKPPSGGKANLDDMTARFKKLFDSNEPSNGGSFYLQSKVLRARERIELEVRQKAEKEELEAELKEGWKPRLYKD